MGSTNGSIEINPHFFRSGRNGAAFCKLKTGPPLFLLYPLWDGGLNVQDAKATSFIASVTVYSLASPEDIIIFVLFCLRHQIAADRHSVRRRALQNLGV